jgi:hypothetical protein
MCYEYIKIVYIKLKMNCANKLYQLLIFMHAKHSCNIVERRQTQPKN